MIEELPLLPTIPEGIRDAAARGALVPFVGAGASLLAGCPSWDQLARGALKTFLDQRHLTYAQLAQLQSLSARVRLSIALGLQMEKNLRIDFAKLLEPTGGYENAMGRRVYNALSKMAKTFITTNYDGWLDAEYGPPVKRVTTAPTTASKLTKRQMYDEVKDFTAENLSSPGVFHVHGSLHRPGGMVITTRQYLRHYANDHHSAKPEEENRLLTFLSYLFKHRTVLFVGYSLEELEILEYVIQKARDTRTETGPRETKHYMLQGYFSHELEVMRAMRSYYSNECGIDLIGYRRDERDWDQLAEVLEDFATHVSARDPMLAQEFLDMEGLLDGP